jgi:glyoxylase I family protein
MSSPAIRLRGLDHVVLRVADPARSLSFYETVLGCREERRIDEIGLIQLRAGACLIDLVGIDTPLGRAGGEGLDPKSRNLDHFALSLVDFDFKAIQTHLSNCGIECPEPSRRYGADGFGPSIYIEDPDGNVVELKGPPESSAPPDDDAN